MEALGGRIREKGGQAYFLSLTSNLSESFRHDEDGNLTSDGSYTYTGDGENRLIEVWPNSLRQKCQVHKLRNILSKLPRGVQGEIKKQILRVFEAQDYAEGLRRSRF